MNFFVWFGIFAVIAIVATICLPSTNYNFVICCILGIALMSAMLTGCVGVGFIRNEHDVAYQTMQNKIRKAQLESYIETVEYPKALEQMYFDDIMEFNRNVYHAEKYGDKWMMRWILYNPSYIGIEPIDLEGFE